MGFCWLRVCCNTPKSASYMLFVVSPLLLALLERSFFSHMLPQCQEGCCLQRIPLVLAATLRVFIVFSCTPPQAQLDDLREAHERLRLESASEIRKLRREAREGAKAVEEAAMTAGEAEDQVRYRCCNRPFPLRGCSPVDSSKEVCNLRYSSRTHPEGGRECLERCASGRER